MCKYEQIRAILAHQMLALDYKNVILGEIIKQRIEENYLPDLRRKLDRTRDEDVSEREKLEKVIAMWEKELADFKKDGNLNEWNTKGGKIIADWADSIGMSGEAEEAAQEFAVGIIMGNNITNTLNNFDPEKGRSELMALWLTSIKRKSHTFFQTMKKKNPMMVNKVAPVQTDDGEMDVLDNLAGTKRMQEGDVDKLIKEMRKGIAKDSKVKGNDNAESLLEAWFEAVDTHNNLGKVEFKRDVYPRVVDTIGLTYQGIMAIWRRKVNPAIIRWAIGAYPKKDKKYLERVFSASEQGKMVDRLADEFYEREMKAWLVEPSLIIGRFLKKAYAKV